MSLGNHQLNDGPKESADDLVITKIQQILVQTDQRKM